MYKPKEWWKLETLHSLKTICGIWRWEKGFCLFCLHYNKWCGGCISSRVPSQCFCGACRSFLYFSTCEKWAQPTLMNIPLTRSTKIEIKFQVPAAGSLAFAASQLALLINNCVDNAHYSKFRPLPSPNKGAMQTISGTFICSIMSWSQKFIQNLCQRMLILCSLSFAFVLYFFWPNEKNIAFAYK